MGSSFSCAPAAWSDKGLHEWLADDPRFVDATFPPTDSSLGDAKPGRFFITAERRANARWIRIPELLHYTQHISAAELADRAKSGLSWQGMSAGDLTQGFLGNCWLVASIAVLASCPGVVQSLFLEADPAAGRFVIRLYDMEKASWEAVEVDDFVPCTLEDDWSGIPFEEKPDGTRVYRYEHLYDASGARRVYKKWVPLFGRPNGRQVWALILEKAMAKFVGSYGYLAGGTEPFALMALTGFPIVYVFQRPATDDTETAAVLGQWEWLGAQYAGRTNTGITSTPLPDVPDDLLDDELWSKLLEYTSKGCPVTASITRFTQVQSIQDFYRPDGLISGHAYALLDAQEVLLSDARSQSRALLRLVALKNPHGDWKASGGTWSSTWTGDWGQQSDLWQSHPEVAQQLTQAGAAVGVSSSPSTDPSPGGGQQTMRTVIPGSESCFWMPWDDFKSAFDKLCVLAKPHGAAEEKAICAAAGRGTLEQGLSQDVLRDRSCSSELCPSLAKLADRPLRQELRQLSITFDPFLTLPEFLDDGSMETRLRWEASKPGRLLRLLEANKTNNSYSSLQNMVSNLGLESALGPTASHRSGRCRWAPPPRPVLRGAKPKDGSAPTSWQGWVTFPAAEEASEGCVVS